MTLPSTRRPPEVEKWLKEEAGEENSNQSLKLKMNLKDVFMESMKAWYDYMNQGNRDQLTKQQVIKRAVVVAYNLRLPYKNLPMNWLRILHDDHGLSFRLPKKKRNRGKYLWKRHISSKPQQPLPTKTKYDDKKFVDLTMEPPPRHWLEAYKEKRYILPRTLKVVKTLDDVTVMYYDYPDSAKPDENGSKICKLTIPHDRDGVWGSGIKCDQLSGSSAAN